MVGGVDLAAHQVARLELDELVRAGADRLQVGGRLARLGADEGLEHVLGQQPRPSACVAQIGVGFVNSKRTVSASILVDALTSVVGAEADRGRRRIGGVAAS